MTEGEGLPIAVAVTGAQVHEQKVLLPVVDQVRVARRRGPAKRRPKTLAADRGYDSRTVRQALRRRGIQPSIPQRVWRGRRRRRGRPPKVHPASLQRWKVERSHAWLDNWRRLVTRYERHAHVYLAFLIIACLMTCLRRILG